MKNFKSWKWKSKRSRKRTKIISNQVRCWIAKCLCFYLIFKNVTLINGILICIFRFYVPLNWIILHNSFFSFLSFFLSPIETNGDVALFWMLFIIAFRLIEITPAQYCMEMWLCTIYCVLCTRCSYTRSKTFNKIKSTNINHFGVFVTLLFFVRFEAFTASFTNWLWIKSRWYILIWHKKTSGCCQKINWENIQRNLNAIAIVIIIIVIFGSDSMLKMEFKRCDEQNEVADLTNEKFMNAIDESFWVVFIYSTMLANYQGVFVYIIDPNRNQPKRFFIPFFYGITWISSIAWVTCFMCVRNCVFGKTVRKKRKKFNSHRPFEIIEGTIAIHIDFQNVKLKAIYVFRLLFLLSFITIDTYCSVDGEFLFIFIPFEIMISAFRLKNVRIIPSLGPLHPKSPSISWSHWDLCTKPIINSTHCKIPLNSRSNVKQPIEPTQDFLHRNLRVLLQSPISNGKKPFSASSGSIHLLNAI